MPRRTAAALFLLSALTASAATAQTDGEAATTPQRGTLTTPLTVATRHIPPFAMRDADGHWRGIAIDLWTGVADQLGVDYRYVDMGLAEMLDAVAAGRADAAVAALTITSAREKRVDFSHPFHTSGLGIAVQQNPGGGALTALRRMLSGQFLAVLGGLLGLLTLVGVLIWLAERHRNTQFDRGLVKGIGAGLWWSAVTMTTVGYGDKAPATLAGRAIGMVWMFAGIILISGFTAAITTALTVGELDQSVRRLDDLYRARVLTLAGSTSDGFLSDNRVRHQTVGSLPEALAMLADDQADAVVYDAPILKYLVAAEHPGTLRVLPYVLQRQDYGIALPQGSPAREPVNEALLRIIRSESWQARLEQYLGRAD
jgi:ABC-type amino acid transport substrate-binding protein